MKRPPVPRDGVIPGVGAYETDRPGFLMAGTARFGDVWQVAPHVHMVAGLDGTRQVLRRTGQEFGTPRGTFALPSRARRENEAVEAMRIRTLRHGRVARNAGVLAVGAAELADSWPVGGETEALPRLADAVAEMTARYHFGPDADELLHAETELVRLRGTVGPRYVHLPGWVPVPARLRVRHCRQRLAARIERVVDRRVEVAAFGTGGDVLGELMRACARSGVNPAVYLPFRMVTAMVAAREMVGPAAGWV
ncbi:hypothetical protein AB0J52_35030, partial [Spirillospora sp. NPDC049652]